MGLVKNITIIGLVAALSLYGTEAQVIAVTGPAAGTAAAGEVTTGVVSGFTVTAAVMVAEKTVNADGAIAVVTATSNNTPGFTITSTIFEVHATSGALSFTGTSSASTSASPYTAVVIVGDTGAAAGAATGQITFTITVNALPVLSGTRCWLLMDAMAASTTLSTYSATDASTGSITYSITAGSNTGSDFAIGSTTGILTTAGVMAVGTVDVYTLILEATDGAAWPAVGTMAVLVSVEGTESTPQSCGTTGLLGSLLVVMAVLVAQFM